jgi:hypothetical protein
MAQEHETVFLVPIGDLINTASPDRFDWQWLVGVASKISLWAPPSFHVIFWEGDAVNL